MWTLYGDTREKQMLDIKPGSNISSFVVQKLPFGDYAAKLDGSNNFLPVFWERKSLADLWGTLTTGMDRFKAEVARAKESNVTLYLGIEASMTDVYKGFDRSDVLGSQIIRTLYTFKTKYGVEPVFCNSRDELKYHVIETYDALDRNYAG